MTTSQRGHTPQKALSGYYDTGSAKVHSPNLSTSSSDADCLGRNAVIHIDVELLSADETHVL